MKEPQGCNDISHMLSHLQFHSDTQHNVLYLRPSTDSRQHPEGSFIAQTEYTSMIVAIRFRAHNEKEGSRPCQSVTQVSHILTKLMDREVTPVENVRRLDNMKSTS